MAGVVRKMMVWVAVAVVVAFGVRAAASAAQIEQPTGVIPARNVVDPGGHNPPELVVSMKELSNQKMKESKDVTRVIVKSKAWDNIIFFASRSLLNNVWGKAPGESLTSTIYLKPDGGFGWAWDRLNPEVKPGQTIEQPIFPNVRMGGSPWVVSKVRPFPIKVKDVTNAVYTLTYDFGKDPTGRYNLAYDMFLCDTAQASRTPRPKAEVMIWVRGSAGQPEDAYKGEASDGLFTYEFYSWTMEQNRIYYAFVMKDDLGPRATHTVNVRKLLDTLPLNPEWYIPGVELGGEIWEGSGRVEIRDLKVSINGFDL